MTCLLAWSVRTVAGQEPAPPIVPAGSPTTTTAPTTAVIAPQPQAMTLRPLALQPTPDVAHAAAQQAERRVSAVVSVGKWVTLGAAAATAVYGFSESRRADDLYDELERDCQSNPDTCRGRDERGRYLDAEFESRYQDVLGIDRRTRQALFVSQASLLASAVLFVLDLRGDTSRPDVPYTPPRLRVVPSPDGRLDVGLFLPFAHRERVPTVRSIQY
ncbi:MAG: hypothetical protein ACREKM_07660 [Longimicrobiales bacterium]